MNVYFKVGQRYKMDLPNDHYVNIYLYENKWTNEVEVDLYKTHPTEPDKLIKSDTKKFFKYEKVMSNHRAKTKIEIQINDFFKRATGYDFKKHKSGITN